MERIRHQRERDTSIDLKNFNRMVDRANLVGNITMSPGSVSYSPSGIHLSPFPAGDTFPWAKVSFGYKIDPDADNTIEVRIYAGDVNGVTIAETNVECSSGTNIVYARVEKAAGGAGTIQIAGSLPAEDATYWYYHLYTFERTGTVVVFTKATRPYNIETGRQLPSNASATQYHVLQISADVGAADDPTKWTIATVKWI